MTTAPILRATRVERSPADAFRIFTEEIGAWWPLPTHGMFGAESGGVVFVDGELRELRTDGSHAVWGEIRVWSPPSKLSFTWHPGRTADDASEVDVEFTPDGTGTRVVLTHSGWEAFGPDAASRRRQYVGPGAWGYVLDHLADGAEKPDDGPDLTGLTAAYAAFLDMAARGDFGPAPDGEWDAAETIAHVTLNDAAMLAVCHGIVHDREVMFENVVSQDPAVLSRWIERHRNLEALIGACRAMSVQVLGVLRRLNTEQRAHLVRCRLLHDGVAMVDDERPWGAIAIDVQAGMHLPAHTSQLADLRS